MDERDRLLAAIAADPDAVENWIVYADWLTERDDPRGELINLEIAIEAGATDEAVIDRHLALLRDEEALLSPRLAERAHHYGFVWWRGFIEGAAPFGPDDDPLTSEDLEALYADPHACVLRMLTLPQALHDTLATLTCSSVRVLRLLGCGSALPLAHGFPLLEHLQIRNPSPIEELAHPRVTMFTGHASALLRCDLPRLRLLESEGDALGLFAPDAILSRPPRSLTSLLLESDGTTELIGALRTSGVLPQLRELRMALSRPHVEELARDPRPFQHIAITGYGGTETSAEREDLLRWIAELLPLAKPDIHAQDTAAPDPRTAPPPPLEAAIGDGIGDAISRLAQRMRDRNSGDR